MKNLPLATFQRWMQQMLLDPPEVGTDDGKGQGALPLKVDEIIKPSKRLAPWQHLALYQHGYTARLRNCMAKQFVALEHALGEELFQAFADEYLHRYPSESYTLANLGDRFEAYLEETRPDKDADIREDWPDFMIEMANFENAINHLFEEQIDDDYQLATASTPDGEIGLIPGLRLYTFKFPVYPYYRAVINGHDPELPPASLAYYAVFRRNFQLKFIDLSAEQHQLLQMIQDGATVPITGQPLGRIGQVVNGELAALWPKWRAIWIKLEILQIAK
jgi:hypothetical protein